MEFTKQIRKNSDTVNQSIKFVSLAHSSNTTNMQHVINVFACLSTIRNAD